MALSQRDSFRDPCDVICLSHLRWRFVFQRPQHLMTRCARERRVFFFEEPLFDAPSDPFLETDTDRGVVVATPHLPPSTPAEEAIVMQRA